MLGNLWSYCVQVLLLVGCGALLPMLFGVRRSKPYLIYCQLLLAVCALLPLIEPWRHTVIAQSAPAIVTAEAFSSSQAVSTAGGISWDLASVLVFLLIAGVAMRLTWLCLGLWRLRRLRERAVPLHPTPPGVEAALDRTGVAASVCTSSEVDAAVTFGWLAPVILLPGSVTAAGRETQYAVACHELLHIRRRDWLFGLAEEIFAAVFWFHPAVWWLHGQIRLTREQVVDQETVKLTGAPGSYVQALVEMARSGAGLITQPAPLFLMRRHLVQRIRSLVNDTAIPRWRMAASYTSIVCVLGACCWMAVATFPLVGQTTRVADSPGITVDPGETLIHRSPIRAAVTGSAAGTVWVDLELDDTGEVTAANVVSGPEDLSGPVLDSVFDWHYVAGPKSTSVRVTFQPPPVRTSEGVTVVGADPSAMLIESIDYDSAPEVLRDELRSRLDQFIGQTPTKDLTDEIGRITNELDRHLVLVWNVAERETLPGEDPLASGRSSNLSLSFRLTDAGRVAREQRVIDTLREMREGSQQQSSAGSEQPDPERPAPGRVRVGGNVQQAKLVYSAAPVYPPLAREARITGVVRFNVVIDKQGNVSSMTLIQGHPLLVQSAMEALRQWRYRPTLFNGNPVEVQTVVDVQFSLR